MKDFKKQRGRRAQYFRMGVGVTVMAALALVAYGTASAAWGMYGKFTDAAAADEAGQQELVTLKAQFESVSTTVEGLDTARGMGAAVRERYGLGLPGEREIDIIREASSTDASSGAPTGFWQGLMQTLFGWM